MFATSHAALRAHLSWCKVSSCDLSPNFGAQGPRSRGAHFWMIPHNGAFLARILIWCQVPLENLTVCFDPNFSCSRRMDFLGKESWDTQPSCTDSFTIATDPFAPPFFDVLLGFPSASPCRKWHLPPCTQPFADLWFRHTGGCQNLHDGFWQNLNRHGISLFLIQRVFLFTAWSLCGLLTLAVSLFCLRVGCKRRRSSFLSLTFVPLFRGTLGSWLKLHESPSTENTFPLSQRRLSFLFLTLGDWSPFHNIVPDSGVSSSHHQINMKFFTAVSKCW